MFRSFLGSLLVGVTISLLASLSVGFLVGLFKSLLVSFFDRFLGMVSCR